MYSTVQNPKLAGENNSTLLYILHRTICITVPVYSAVHNSKLARAKDVVEEDLVGLTDILEEGSNEK